MPYTSELSQSKEYQSFRSSVPLRKIVVDSDGTKVTVFLIAVATSHSCFYQCCFVIAYNTKRM